MERVLIVGTGKLGQRYYQHLIRASTETHPIEVTTLSRSDKSWSPRHIALDLSQPITAADAEQFSLYDTVVCILAPGARDETAYRSTYLDAPRNLFTALKKDSLPHVIWVSSTSVYGDIELSQETINESTVPQPANLYAKILLEAEKAVSDQCPNVSILRPAGLYSSQRQRLLDSLLNPEQYDNPKWLNLVHEDDVCQHLEFLRHNPHKLLIAADGHPFQRAHAQDFLAAIAPTEQLAVLKSSLIERSPRRFQSQYHKQLAFNYPSLFDWIAQNLTKTTR